MIAVEGVFAVKSVVTVREVFALKGVLVLTGVLVAKRVLGLEVVVLVLGGLSAIFCVSFLVFCLDALE
jgi:hypothetical protein